MEGNLICNYKKCRKQVTGFAWVTSCSQDIFCEEDGSREFAKAYTCPACETQLSEKYDIIRIDVRPSEQYKSMVLAGQKPETVMEICTRALSFWTYQVQQEITYQEYVSGKARERTSQLEVYYENIVVRVQAELTSLKSQLAAKKKELESTKKKCHDLTDSLADRNRQFHKLQTLYEAMRRKCITPLQQNGNDPPPPDHPRSARRHIPSMSLHNAEDLIRSQSRPPSSGHDVRRLPPCDLAQSPPEREFVFQPRSTPVLACEDDADLSLQSLPLFRNDGRPAV